VEVCELVRRRRDQSEWFEVFVWREESGRGGIANLEFGRDVGRCELLIKEGGWGWYGVIEADLEVRPCKSYRDGGLLGQ
jgi:hypothetical protein